MLKKLWTVFLAILCVLVLVLIYMVWQLHETVIAVSQEFAENLQLEEEPGDVQGSGNQIMQLYAMLYEQLEAYDLQDAYGQESTELANTLLDRTLKNMSIESIEWQKDGFLITVTGTGASLDDLSEEMLAKAISSAAYTLIRDNFLDLSVSLIQNDQDALKELVFKEMGPELFASLNEQIASLPDTQTTSRYRIRIEGDTWKLESLDDSSDTQ